MLILVPERVLMLMVVPLPALVLMLVLALALASPGKFAVHAGSATRSIRRMIVSRETMRYGQYPSSSS